MTTQALRDLQHALERCYVGDQSIEAGAVADALDQLGWRLTPAAPVRVRQEPLPLEASTRRLGRRRTA